jgi:hypothetical protein
LAEPLLRNGSCIYAYLTVIAQQWVCMPQYEQKSVDINFHLTKREKGQEVCKMCHSHQAPLVTTNNMSFQMHFFC